MSNSPLALSIFKILGKKYNILSTMLAKATLKVALEESNDEIFENEQIWKLL